MLRAWTRGRGQASGRGWSVVAGLVLGVVACGSGPPSPAQLPPPPDTLRVLAYNIHHAEGTDERVDLERIADLIRELDPDLVALQEVDSVTERTGRVDQAAVLGRLTGMAPVFGRFMRYRGGAYGMAVLSRWPLEDWTNLSLPPGREPRTALSVLARSPETGRLLRFVGVHLYATEQERLAQAERLEDHLDDDDVPTILAGDFNSLPGSRVMDRPGAGWSVLEKDGDRLTFPSHDPEREIDFVLVRPGHRFRVLRHWLLDESVASDHRPVVADLVLRS